MGHSWGHVWGRTTRAALALLLLAALGAPGAALAAPPAASPLPVVSERTLTYGGQPLRLVRTAYGIPHVYADDLGALFFGSGYATAEDRLWQAEVYRRSGAGTLAEVGLGTPQGDAQTRLHDYTEAEYAQMFAAMPADVQTMFRAYADGLNAYLAEAAAAPLAKLPVEFLFYGFTPAPWTVTDVLKGGVFFTRRFGETGGADLGNLQLLQQLTQAHGAAAAAQLFDDLRWTDDPDSYASNPGPGAARPGRAGGLARRAPDVAAALAETEAREEAWKRDLSALGVPTKGGSNAWLVAPWRSAGGQSAFLHGGPQMGYSIPQITLEVGLHGAGWDVLGMTFAGVAPYPLIGRGRHHAWTTTTGTTDTRDHVLETLNPQNPLQYWHQGRWVDMERRVELVAVRGQTAPVALTVLRTVHGPVVSHDPAAGVAVALERAHWKQELSSILGFAGFNRAHNVQQFAAAVSRVATSHHFFYADRHGNIAYWLSGREPVRPAGTDSRLPRDGRGGEEWQGFVDSGPRTQSINPAQGYVVNWNNKAVAGWDNGDSGTSYGPTHRVNVLVRILERKGRLDWQDVQDVNREAGTTHVDGLAFRPLLLEAAASLRAERGPLGAPVEAALAQLAAWDDRFVDGNGDGQYDAVGLTLFEAWLPRMRARLFTPVLGNDGGSGGLGVLWRLMRGPGRAALPVHYDWLKGRDVRRLAVDALADAVAALGAGGAPMEAWRTPVRVQAYAVQGALPAVQHPFMNRGTYNQVVELWRTGARSANVNPPGQNGFVRAPGVPGPSTHDQLLLYATWQYKPMVLDPLKGE